MKTSIAKLQLVGFSIVLSLAAGAVGYAELRLRREPRFVGSLSQIILQVEQVSDWQFRMEEIAATPELKKAIAATLNYDDAIYCSYTKGNERISVYIAYWKPGRMSHRLVGGHTPDVCWVGNGWEMLQRDSRVALPPARGYSVQPAELRQMTFSGNHESIIFWHIVGDRVQSYPARLPPWHAMFTDLFVRGFNQCDEQFFIRLSSTLPNGGWGTSVADALTVALKMGKVPL